MNQKGDSVLVCPKCREPQDSLVEDYCILTSSGYKVDLDGECCEYCDAHFIVYPSYDNLFEVNLTSREST